MGLFGEPSEEVIRGYNNAAQPFSPLDASPITLKQVEHFRLKPGGLQFSTSAELIGLQTFSLSAYVDVAKLSCLCVKETIDLLVDASAPSSQSLEFLPLKIRHGELLLPDDVTVLRQSEECQTQVPLVRKIALISTSDLEVCQIDLASFEGAVRRFSFPDVKNDHPTTFPWEPKA